MHRIFFGTLSILAASTLGYFTVAHHVTNINLANLSGSAWGSPEYNRNLNELLDIVQKQDPRAALTELSKRMETNKTVFNNCHFMAHAIGRASYKKYGDFDKALQYQDPVCSDGYLHGVIEGKFTNLKDTNAAIAALKTICSNYTYADRCWHGTGHGIMFFTKNDLPKSLGICNTYGSSHARGRCYEGVFMENFLSDPDSHPSDYVNSVDPMQPCAQQASMYKSVCYFYVPIYYLAQHDNDYTSALAWCEGAGAYANACVKGVGSLAMKYNIDDPKQVEKLCMGAKSSRLVSCIDGMTSYYLTFAGNSAKVSAMCATLEPANKATCQASLRKRMLLF